MPFDDPRCYRRAVMPLQNRVTPWGEIVAVEARGLLMGNRGRLHDGARRIVRHALGRRWIACVLEFRGRHRVVMTPNRYTELFFLDEATALAAGHRPCAECRRADYERFQAAWASAIGPDTSADGMDVRLDADRLIPPRGKRTYTADARSLPDGAVVDVDGVAWLVWQGAWREWTPVGYTERRAAAEGSVTVLTPHAIVEVMRAGYAATAHPTAEIALGGDGDVDPRPARSTIG